MIQFNLKRFGKLACWTFRNDKRYIVKSFLQAFVILLLIFLFFTMMPAGELAVLLTRACEMLDRYIAILPDDGGCDEGAG